MSTSHFNVLNGKAERNEHNQHSIFSVDTRDFNSRGTSNRTQKRFSSQQLDLACQQVMYIYIKKEIEKNTTQELKRINDDDGKGE